jgi:3-dehydroshikimate dehydratase
VTRAGLCSVTFRALTPREVAEAAAAAGLQTVEWGADVHAPPDQPATLRGVRDLTAAAGLTTCSYGSYWRAGTHTADLAATHDLEIACEFHAGTLADTPDAVLDLLAEVDHPALSTYWQPPLGTPADTALAGLAGLLQRTRVSAVHVFSWWPAQTRLPLQSRAFLWRGALDLVATRLVDLLLEFVPDDDPAILAREAETLRSWSNRACG